MSSVVDSRKTPLLTAVRRGVLALGAASVLGLGLSACGGGDQVKTFKPTKVVSFGDENSVLASEVVGADAVKGLKYTVNSVVVDRGVTFSTDVPEGAAVSLSQFTADYPDAPTADAPVIVSGTGNSVVRRFLTMDVVYTLNAVTSTATGASVGFDYLYQCTANRLWIQLVANAYGLGYQGDCGLDSAGAVTHAVANATVDGVRTQVDQSIQAGELNDSTLVTLLAGQNDILAAYDSADSTDVAAAALRLKGQQLGGIIRDIINTGARVLFVTVPDLSYSPKARAGGATGQARMQALVVAFNDGLLGLNGAPNDGHHVGRVKGFEQVKYMVDSPSSHGLINVDTAACASGRTPTGDAVASTTAGYVRYCNSTTLTSGATAFNYLWADDTHLSPAYHASLGNLAYVRARDNPF